MFKAIYNFFYNHFHTHYNEVYAHAKKLFVFDLILLATAIIMLAGSLFFFFWKPGITDLVDVKISLGSNRIKSGELLTLTIDYKNRSKYYLKEPILALHLPAGFVIDRNLTPAIHFNNDSTFNLDDIRPGANGQATIYGRLWSLPKQEEKILALLSYLPENSSNREQKNGVFLANLADSILKTSLEMTSTSFSNVQVPFVFKLINTSDVKLEGLNFNFNFPGKINGLKETDLNNFTLDKAGEKLITGEIVMPTKTGQYGLEVTVSATINNQQIKILTNKTFIQTFSHNVHVSSKIIDKISFVEPNQTFSANIAWQNNGQYELKNSKIHLSFSPGIVDIKTTAKENGFGVEGENLVISANERTALANGKPQTNGDFDFKIYLLPTFNVGAIENATLEIRPTFISELKDVPGQQFSAQGDTSKILLTTELSLTPQVRYYSNEGDQLGRGPLPPQVGETTKYWIFVRANNTSNPVSNAVFSASLAEGVNFTGKQSVSIGPAIVFDETKRTLNWNFRELPPNSQTGLYFEVAVTPSPEQIGKNIILINNIKFTANDKITGKEFNLTKSVINNVLPNIDLGSKKGSLVE